MRKVLFSVVLGVVTLLAIPAMSSARPVRGGFRTSFPAPTFTPPPIQPRFTPSFRGGFTPGFQGRFNPRFNRGFNPRTNLGAFNRLERSFFPNFRPTFTPGFRPIITPGIQGGVRNSPFTPRF